MTPDLFKQLFGFPERSPDEVRQGLQVEDERLVSRVNGAAHAFGRLEIPSLVELRSRVKALNPDPLPSTCREIVADAQSLHADPANAGALFQVASQFNLLEMCGPNETPEMGVYLTLLGGGVFGNRMEWIADAIQHAVGRTIHLGLDIRIVSYRSPNPALMPRLSE
ncbi:MAG: hypothetical protein JJU29_10550 [Verrucomicrobia bacterium]|nr:hypothetical protein [Verrucomicrobiota bacterium]